jgi:DNA-binding Lrp family transcriptional regulator
MPKSKMAPLEFEPVHASNVSSKTKLKKLLDTQESNVLKAITFLRRKCKLTQEAVMEKTGYSKDKVTNAIKSLHSKGYIDRSTLRYRYIELLAEPIEYNGMLGLPTQPSSTTLIFNPITRTLRKVKTPVKGSDHKEDIKDQPLSTCRL